MGVVALSRCTTVILALSCNHPTAQRVEEVSSAVLDLGYSMSYRHVQHNKSYPACVIYVTVDSGTCVLYVTATRCPR